MTELPFPNEWGHRLLTVYGDKDGYVLKDVLSFLDECAYMGFPGSGLKVRATELAARLRQANERVRVDVQVVE